MNECMCVYVYIYNICIYMYVYICIYRGCQKCIHILRDVIYVLRVYIFWHPLYILNLVSDGYVLGVYL